MWGNKKTETHILLSAGYHMWEASGFKFLEYFWSSGLYITPTLWGRAVIHGASKCRAVKYHWQPAAVVWSQVSFKPWSSMYHVPVQHSETASVGKLHVLAHPSKYHRLQLLSRQQRLSKVTEKIRPSQQLWALLFATHNLSNCIKQYIHLK